MKKTVGVFFGGVSSEYEVSLISATSVIKNIDSNLFDIKMFYISKEGEIFYYTGDVENIKDASFAQNELRSCTISCNRAKKGAFLFDDQSFIPFDVAFPVLHGKNGEDGTIQGLFTLAGIPFVGCGTLASAACMDKVVTHTILDKADINTTEFVCTKEFDYLNNKDAFLNDVSNKIGFPCFVKPANAGSSVGISKAKNIDELRDALSLAFKHDKKVLCEKAVSGLEIECAVLGNDDPIASVLGEIEPCNEFYDYDAKYLANKTVTYIPARIDQKVSNEIRETAIKAFKAMDCSGFSRVDFFLTNDNRILINEINTIPGFTSISMYPQLFEKSGIPYKELVTKLIMLALKKEIQ